MESNYDDVLDQLRAAGLMVDTLTTGRMKRCKVEGDREKRGWYFLHEVTTASGDLLIGGSYGVWQGNNQNTQKIDLREARISSEQREAFRRRIAEDRKRADRERQADAARAALAASKAWAKYELDGDSDYLKRKGVGGFGVRYTKSGAVVIPVTDTAGRIHGLQFIRTAAQATAARRPTKEFWPAGVAKKGHFHLLGVPGPVLLIAEGYATAASLHMATNLPVAVAFDAGNLVPVAIELRKRYRTARLLVCADDDAFTDGNPGVTSASTAAMEVNGAWIKPAFADESARRERFERGLGKLTDFNDLHVTDGLRAVGAQVETRLLELKWTGAGASLQRTPAEGGRGDSRLRPIETVDELLERYALVAGHGGTVFDRELHAMYALSDSRDMCRARETHRAWMEHPERQIVRMSEVGFDPSESDPAITCNLYGGWPTTPVAGKCDKLLELLWYMTEREVARQELYDWVLRWIAYPIQNPGAKLKTTLVLHGPQGTGKNLFFEALMGIYGPYGRVIDQPAIEDKFNDWASKKLFLIADEVVARSDIYHVKNKLKAFITGDWIRINPKNVAAYDEKNHVNLVFLSNEAHPVQLEEDDRRHAVIWTPDKLPPAFYTEVAAEIRNGGIAALHDYLLKVDMRDFTPATLPPYTAAKRELVEISMDSPSQFYYALEERDVPVFGKDMGPAFSTDVYDVYRAWCARTGVKCLSMPRLLNSLDRRHKVRSARKRYMDSNAAEAKTMRTVLLFGRPVPPDGVDERYWVGEHAAAFHNKAVDYLKGDV